VSEPEGLGAGSDDVPAEGEAVGDGGEEPWVGERLGPSHGEAVVGGDRRGILLFPLGQNLDKQFCAAFVQFMYPSSSMQRR
jgi:hypothetical protein